MKKRHALAAFALVVGALSPAIARADSAAPSDYAFDENGKQLRIGFDPGDRMTIGVGWAFDDNGPRSSEVGAIQVSTGVAFRHRIVFPDDGIIYKLDHEIGAASMTSGERLSIVGEAYRLHFLRWSEDGKVVLPTTPPKRLAFPLDIGFEVGAGAVDLRREHGLAGELGVARGEVIFDVIRRPDHRGYLTFGVGPRYLLRIANGKITDQVIAPFSQPEIDARVELGQGHHVLEARAGGGYAWSVEHGGGKQARADLSYELVVASVNDSPVSIRAETSFRYDDPALPGRAPVEARGGASAVFGLPLP